MVDFFRIIGLKTWAYLTLAFAMVGMLYKVYTAGVTSAEVDSLKTTLKTVKGRDKNETNISNLDDDDVNSRLRKNGWVRD